MGASRQGLSPRRPRTASVLWLVLAVLFLAALASAFYVGVRAMTVQGALSRATAAIEEFRDSEFGTHALAGSSSMVPIIERARVAVDQADAGARDPIWSAYERVPGFGANLRSMRQTAEALGPLVRRGGEPLTIKPTGTGESNRPAVYLAALEALQGRLEDSARGLEAVDATGALPQFIGPVVRLRADVRSARSAVADDILLAQALKQALEAGPTRRYLVILNDASSPTAPVLVTVRGRTITGTRRALPDVGLRLFSAAELGSTSRFTARARSIARSWNQAEHESLDGVVVVAPEIIRDLVDATGPLRASGTPALDAAGVAELIDSHPARFASKALPSLLRGMRDGDRDLPTIVSRLSAGVLHTQLRVWSATA